jgi:hypothetical protein
VAFRFLSADEHPDHSTLAEFRKRNLLALAGLFLQALQLCAKAGLIKLDHVAIDGTKIKAMLPILAEIRTGQKAAAIAPRRTNTSSQSPENKERIRPMSFQKALSALASSLISSYSYRHPELPWSLFWMAPWQRKTTQSSVEPPLSAQTTGNLICVVN